MDIFQSTLHYLLVQSVFSTSNINSIRYSIALDCPLPFSNCPNEQSPAKTRVSRDEKKQLLASR